jgi:membrane protease YdiL (CAAX protease family)
LTVQQERQSIVRAVGVYGSMLGISAIAMIAAAAGGGELTFAGFTVETIAFSVAVLIWSLLSYSLLTAPLSRVGPWRWVLSAVPMGFCTFIVASLAILALQQTLGLDDFRYLEVFEEAGHGLGLATLYIAVQPAIFEELAFRGIIYDSLRRVTGSTEAIFASAAMFAILHLSVPSFMHLFFMGIVLAWMRERSGSLYPGMIVHFTHNFLCLVQEQNGVVLPW